MSTKADYTPDEWQLLLDVPPLVGTAVMVAGRSGLGSVKEAMAVASGTLNAKDGYEDNELIEALIEGRIKDGDRAEIERLGSDYRGQRSVEIRGAAVKKCQQVTELLLAKSNDAEASQYKHWAISVAQKVASAAKEGGFLGIGGERVSESEQEIIEAVTTALGVG